MKTNYSLIAIGTYVRERRGILKDLGTWEKMTDEEKSFFRPCYFCKQYTNYIASKATKTCPCSTCKHCKTEIQVDNRMTALRRKYFKGDD